MKSIPKSWDDQGNPPQLWAQNFPASGADRADLWGGSFDFFAMDVLQLGKTVS